MKNYQNLVTVLGVLIVILLLGLGQTNNRNQQASAQSSLITSRQQLHLFDGNNQDLGVLVRAQSNDGRYATYIKLDNLYDVVADFQEHGAPSVFDPVATELYFTQTNCMGDAFMRLGQHSQQVFYENFHRNSGYFVQRLETFISGYGNIDPRKALSQTGQNGCIGSNDYINNTVLVQPVTLPFHEPLTWPLRVGYPSISAQTIGE